LRRAAEDAGAALQERVEKAQSLRDDLAFMIERADSMAGRLEDTVRQARGEVRPPAAASPRPAAPGRPSPAPSPAPLESRPADDAVAAEDERSEAERELLRALQSVR
jgi:hypothetical protein